MWAARILGGPHFHTPRSVREPRCGCGALGRSRAAFYSRSGDRPDQRAACLSHRRGRHLRDDESGATTQRTALTPRLVASPLRRRRSYGRRQRATSKTVPSRQIANRMRLRRRASATTAIRLPRRAASCSVHARKGPLPTYSASTPTPPGPTNCGIRSTRLSSYARVPALAPNYLRAAPTPAAH